MTSETDIEVLLTDYPHLESGGFQVWEGKLTPAQREEKHRALQAELLHLIREIDICRLWLRTFADRRATMGNAPGSYTLKHVVEKWSGVYIPNGAFIAAAVLEGVSIKHTDGPNALIGIRIDYYRRYERTGGPAMPDFDESLLG